MPLRNQFESEAEWLEHMRMYFAAKAMHALLSRHGTQDTMESFAAYSYEMASAMLSAREAKS